MTLFNKLFTRRSQKSSQAATIPAATSRPRSRPIGHAYILVVDESGSTGNRFRLAGNRTTSRIDAIRRAARNYLHQLRATHAGQKVAVVGFSQLGDTVSPPEPGGTKFRRP